MRASGSQVLSRSSVNPCAMEDRWEKVQLGLHALLFSSALYAVLVVGHLWTGGSPLFGIEGLTGLGVIGGTMLLVLARLLLLAAPGAGWGLAALLLDLAGSALVLGSRDPLYRGLGTVLHVAAALVSLGQLEALARHLERRDLTVWIRRMAFLLVATGLGLVLALLGLEGLGFGLAAISFGLAAVRYLRLVNALGVEVSKDLRLWRNME